MFSRGRLRCDRDHMSAMLATIALEQKGVAFDWQLTKLLKADRLRWELLRYVGSLLLPDCWIGAGFVRNAILARDCDSCGGAVE